MGRDRLLQIRLTEAEYQSLKADAQGYKSISYYVRSLISDYRLNKAVYKTKPIDLSSKSPQASNLAFGAVTGAKTGLQAFEVGNSKENPPLKAHSVKHYDLATSPQAESNKVAIGNQGKKIGRNAPCPCGSGRKFKRCCGR